MENNREKQLKIRLIVFAFLVVLLYNGSILKLG